jgi:hypothetical protein
MTQYFLFFALGLLFFTPVGPYFALIISLPLLFSINQALLNLGKTVRPEESHHKRRLTNFCVVVISNTLAISCIGGIIGNQILLLSCGTIVCYLLIIGVYIRIKLPLRPVEEEPVELRVIAGREGIANVTLVTRTKLNGILFIVSPYDWCKVTPNTFIPLNGNGITLRISVTPELSGPTAIKFTGYVIAPWGLIQVRFEIEPLILLVIPRAKYAEWLANKYLSGSKPGTLPLVSSIGLTKPLYGLRQGVEYYGCRMYQPGDSLKNIDWKHSTKYNELVSKEFSEVQAQPVIVLINLVAGNDEEMDVLVYNILATAMSLAQDGISATLAVYNDKDVVLVTQSLVSNNLITSAMLVVSDTVIKPASRKYLAPPDITRLRANISRLGRTENQSARTLRELLQLEYKNLSNNTILHPCRRAFTRVMSRTNQQSTVVILSNRNHDAEALALISSNLTEKGSTVIMV